MKTFIIAEAGVNHNGREDLALQLVEIAAKSGANAIKFQTFSADRLVRPGAEKADYQKRENAEGDQHSMLKALELSPELHLKLFAACEDAGIEFMSTPFDEEAADFLLRLGMQRIKVPSGEITNEPFLRFLASRGRKMILSTGMATLAEIERAVEVVTESWRRAGHQGDMRENLTILHCTSNYPASLEDVNLRAMTTIAAATGFAVGYSDHTMGLTVSTAAVAMGATVIEKHFTVDRALPGPDHKASLEPPELARLVTQIREVERALGSAEKAPTASELPVRALVRRSVTTARPVAAGDVLVRSDLVLLRPGNGIAPGDIERVVGRRVRVDLPAGSTLSWTELD